MSDPRPQPTGVPAILTALRDNWVVALVVALVVLVPAGVLVVSYKPDYQSEAVVGLEPTRTQSDTFLRALAQQLPSYLLSAEVTEKVADETGRTAQQVFQETTVEIPPATLNLTITATDPDAATAAKIANAMAAEALANKQNRDFYTPVPVATAVPPLTPTGLGKSILIPLTLILAAVAAVVAALIARDVKAARQAPGATAEASASG